MAYINLQNLSVSYPIYNGKTRSIRDHLIKAIGGKVRSINNTVYVQALSNINVSLKEGDRVSLIGHNGAGKSTLLKILSGVYEPTGGHAQLQGKVSSLTDITMGMDQENSGYDNIIMRCIFMGMTFAEAKAKAQDIIDFSELEEYISLPMRTYSTGMYLRLAFAVSTSVVPDILIMDEVINVGDASFLKKASERIESLVSKTKIVVVASHDMNVSKRLCNRGIWLEHGKIIMDGDINEVIDAYNKKCLS